MLSFIHNYKFGIELYSASRERSRMLRSLYKIMFFCFDCSNATVFCSWSAKISVTWLCRTLYCQVNFSNFVVRLNNFGFFAFFMFVCRLKNAKSIRQLEFHPKSLRKPYVISRLRWVDRHLTKSILKNLII